MKKRGVLLFLAVLFACGETNQSDKAAASKEVVLPIDSTTANPTDSLDETGLNEPVAEKATIAGDFDGDGQPDTAWAVRTKEAKGNPLEDGTPAQYAIRFSNAYIPAIPIGCCEVRLMNEGDLNKDGKDELSVFQAPMNGNTYALSTYANVHGTWKQVIKPMLIPVIEEEINEEELQKRIFREKDSIYVYQVDENDKNLRLVKKSITLE